MPERLWPEPTGYPGELEFDPMIELNRRSKIPIGDQLVDGMASLVKER